MAFNKFFALIVGISLIGISIGYVVGFYIGEYTENNKLFYLAVPIMAVGSFITIFITIYKK